jgi:hypothetical protein
MRIGGDTPVFLQLIPIEETGDRMGVANIDGKKQRHHNHKYYQRGPFSAS